MLAELLSARIGAGIAVATAGELRTAGWTTPQKMRDASRPRVVAALGRGGYRRYDERTATQLRELAALVLDRYGGDLRRLAEQADGDAGRAARLLREVKGIGPTGADVFLREVQGCGPGCGRTWTSGRGRAPGGSACPTTTGGSVRWWPPTTWTRFAAGLVRISRLPGRRGSLCAGTTTVVS